MEGCGKLTGEAAERPARSKREERASVARGRADSGGKRGSSFWIEWAIMGRLDRDVCGQSLFSVSAYVPNLAGCFPGCFLRCGRV